MAFAMLLCAVLAIEEPTEVESPISEEVRFFENSIRPLLTEHCLKCHGEQKQWGGLRLDSREATLRGGDSGAAIVPGMPLKSLLIRAVRHEDEDLKMPKRKKDANTTSCNDQRNRIRQMRLSEISLDPKTRSKAHVKA